MATDPFRTRDHVADFDDHVAAYAALSRETRAALPAVLDVPYGDGPAERLDLFTPPGGRGPRPVHLFVHGGYWRMFAKEDFSFVARTVTAAGAIAAVMDYSLMPAVRMDAIVDQVRRAARWLRDNAARHGGDPDRLTASGHSAGAHLCTFLLDDSDPAPVDGAFLLSGVYDLAPLQDSFLAPLIGLTDEEVRLFSPSTRSHAPGLRVRIARGERETAPFHEQATAFAKRLAGQGLDVADIVLSGADHMSAVRQLADPTSQSAGILTRVIRDR